MFALANLLSALARVIDIGLGFYLILIIVRALLSWVSPDPFNPIVRFLYNATEPVLEPIRRILPAGLRSGIDISPLLATLAVVFLKSFLVNTLAELAFRLRAGL